MTDKRFEPGTLVRIVVRDGKKTGVLEAPRMTVRYQVDRTASADTGMKSGVHCFWFNGDNNLCEGVFDPDLLRTSPLEDANS